MGWKDLEFDKQSSEAANQQILDEQSLIESIMGSPAGRELAIILQDRLLNMSVHVPGEPERSAYNEGERAVYQRLYNAARKGE